jgi:squalene-hopene/tetraprenyl-beta-curcumene cyclase
VWDTALAAHALMEVGENDAALRALRWLKPLQILDVMGDWKELRPNIRPGGWAFQYANPHYPDLDDTAVVVMAMDRARKTLPLKDEFDESIERAREWIIGMQSRNGGFASFEVDNLAAYLNNIPFSDHGALLDPPTSDVTARCVSMLLQLGHPEDAEVVKRARAFLELERISDNSWFGRWGMNYVYGTWSVACAHALTQGRTSMAGSAEWLISIQNEDGGWGEAGESYKLDYKGHEKHPSLPCQTAWALLALMAAGRVDSDAVRRGITYLLRTQLPEGGWRDVYHNAPGFPRIFYLCYHGYAQYFTLWALARYRNLKNGAPSIPYGM